MGRYSPLHCDSRGDAMRRITWLTISICIAVLSVIPFPYVGRELNAFSDLAHAPACGLLSLAAVYEIKKLLPRWPFLAVLITWAIVVLLGGIAELAQGLTNRSPG